MDLELRIETVRGSECHLLKRFGDFSVPDWYEMGQVPPSGEFEAISYP